MGMEVVSNWCPIHCEKNVKINFEVWHNMVFTGMSALTGAIKNEITTIPDPLFQQFP